MTDRETLLAVLENLLTDYKTEPIKQYTIQTLLPHVEFLRDIARTLRESNGDPAIIQAVTYAQGACLDVLTQQTVNRIPEFANRHYN